MPGKRSLATLTLTIACGLPEAAATHACTLYVDDDAPPGGDGTTWAGAYRFLQDALVDGELGRADCEVRVAQGVYRPDQSRGAPDGTGDRRESFRLFSGVTLRGGYAGLGAADPDERAPARFETVLSGDLAQNDEPEFVNYDENSRQVMTVGPGQAVTVDGFVITGGNADGDRLESGSGGGIFVDHGRLTVVDTTFRANIAWQRGGGLMLWVVPDAVVERCRFVDNRTLRPGWNRGGGLTSLHHDRITIDRCEFEGSVSHQGGAAYILSDFGHTEMRDCSFRENRSDQDYGAVYLARGTATIEGCRFEGNHAEQSHGAMMAIVVLELSIRDCTFVENTSGGSGSALTILGAGEHECVDSVFAGNHGGYVGALILGSSSTRVLRCTFVGNSGTGGLGGALRVGGFWTPDHGSGQAAITECRFIDNTAASGAAIAVSTWSPIIESCEFVGNRAATRGGAITTTYGGMTKVSNCRITGNEAGEDGGAIAMSGWEGQPARQHVSGCTIVGNTAGTRGGGFAGAEHDTTAVVNCVVWGNEDGSGTGEDAQIFLELGEASVDYSCVQGLTGALGGVGNIGDDPQFVDPVGPDGAPYTGDEDLRLREGSPCADAGVTWGTVVDRTDRDEDGDTHERAPFDFDGLPRFADDPLAPERGCAATAVVDIGAHERPGPAAHPVLLGDLDGDERVDDSDLALLIDAWGPCPPGCCLADFTLDGAVTFDDLRTLLREWTR